MGKNDQSPYLSTAQAAELLAVGVSTVKRWVNEKILPAHVTAGGHRKLMRSEVLAFARQGNMSRGEPAVLAGTIVAKSGTDAAALCSSFLDALVGGSGSVASSVLRNAYVFGLSIEVIADKIIAPAMAKLGHLWVTSQIDVWQEHRGTQLCAAALHQLRMELESRAESNRPLAVGAAPEGDPYSLATFLAQLALIDAGWEAIDLGPNTPLSSLTKAVKELRPRLVWLSASHIQSREEFLAAYRDFYRAAEQEGVAVAIGGKALAESLRSSMSYTSYGDGMNHLAAFARTLNPRPRRPRRGRPPSKKR